MDSNISSINNSSISHNTRENSIGRSLSIHKRGRLGQLTRSIISDESSNSVLSPNSVRGLVNPYRTMFGLPPLEILRTSTSPDTGSTKNSNEATISPQKAISSDKELNNLDSVKDNVLQDQSFEEIMDIPISFDDGSKLSSDLEETEKQNQLVGSSQLQTPLINRRDDLSGFGKLLEDSPFPDQIRERSSSNEYYHVKRKDEDKYKLRKGSPVSVSNPPVAAVIPPTQSALRNKNSTIRTTPIAAKSFLHPSSLTSSQLRSQKRSKSHKENHSSGWKFQPVNLKGKEYLILKKLGKGGSGEVSLVIEKESHGIFALKKIQLTTLDQNGIKECINEVKLLEELKNTKIVVHIETWEIEDGALKILMELGQCDLQTWIEAQENLSLYTVQFVWRRILEIVESIHSRGIVHSDIKPANFVWVAATLKIIDFGIANKLQSDITSVATLNPKGTLNFISPETVCQDDFGRTKIGPKSDIWALGCILHFLVFGKTPFQDISNQMAKISAIIQGVTFYPPVPFQFQKTSVLSVIKSCLDLDPKKRPTATELLAHSFLKEY